MLNQAGFGANPDRRETYGLNTKGPRVPAVAGSDGITFNPADNLDGFVVCKCSLHVAIKHSQRLI